jgi:hypothetical protein
MKKKEVIFICYLIIAMPRLIAGAVDEAGDEGTQP